MTTALDLALPIGQIAEFVARVREPVEALAPVSPTVLYGHLLEGNLHINVLGPTPDDQAVDDAVLRLTVEMGGSISAEHGISVPKAGWLALDRSPADLAAMRAFKPAFDPTASLNAAVLRRT